MDSVRLAKTGKYCARSRCRLCSDDRGTWDRIAEKAYCPNCEERLILGEAPAVVERTARRRCAVCSRMGAVGYVTFPLNSEQALEMDLCPDHLRTLLGRRLGPHAYHQLSRQLQGLGIQADKVFLLHEAFYDCHGRALQPAVVE
jgi:hypothetical protein